MSNTAVIKEKRKETKIVELITERAELFKKFRSNGWAINAVEPVPLMGIFNFTLLPDLSPTRDVHFRVKMPGAVPVLVRSFGQLLRMSKGL